MRNIILFLFLLINLNFIKAQNDVVRSGLIKGMATISPSKMFGYNESYFYLHGSLEAYLNKKVSVTGDGYLFLGSQKPVAISFEYMDNLFFGMNYHFTKKDGDFFVGIHPGVAIAKISTDSLYMPVTHTGVSPVFSAVIGYNYFIGKYFNFFIQSRYVAGDHNFDKHRTLSEIRFSGGLGFNINAIKKK